MLVLVTGGRGFLGAHVCDALRAAGHEAVALGRSDGDLAVPGVAERLLDEHRPDTVVHLAAVMPDDEPRSLEEVARLACRLSGAPESLIELVDPPVGPAPVLEELDVEPLRALGWQPTVELDDGMRRTLDWLSSPAA